MPSTYLDRPGTSHGGTTRPATTRPTRSRPRHPVTATQRHPQRHPPLVPSHEHLVRPRSPTTDDADLHPTAGIAAAPPRNQRCSLTIDHGDDDGDRNSDCYWCYLFIATLPSITALPYPRAHRDACVLLMCILFLNSTPPTTCARIDCHTPSLTLPLQFAHAQVPAATSPHATAGTAQHTRTHWHSPPLHRVGVARAPCTGQA